MKNRIITKNKAIDLKSKLDLFMEQEMKMRISNVIYKMLRNYFLISFDHNHLILNSEKDLAIDTR